MAQPLSKQTHTIESLKQKMERDPLSRAFLQLAEEYRKAGRYGDAARVCQEGLVRHPTYHTARISLGRTYLESGDLESARRTLGEVIEMAPENHLASKLLAEVQRRLGDGAGAAETYRSILRHYPGDKEVAALLKDLEEGAAARSEPVEPSLDYRPEDLAVAPTVPAPGRAASPASRAPVAPAPVPAARRGTPVVSATQSAVPRPHPVEQRPARAPEPGNPDALQTNTLAELYLRQGLVERAVAVYREMLRVDPTNERARARLLELNLEGAGPVNGQEEPAPRSFEPAAVGPAVRQNVRPAPSLGRPGQRATIARLSRWLESITRPKGAGGQERLS